jgi:T5SS/PEP-CTERM-associated repeat protein
VQWQARKTTGRIPRSTRVAPFLFKRKPKPKNAEKGNSAMKQTRFLSKKIFTLLAAVLLGVCMISGAYADILVGGDVKPAIDPGVWTGSTKVYIGYEDDAALSITGGDSVESFQAYVGYELDILGAVNVNGEGSAWNIDRDLKVSYIWGEGMLSITNGGSVAAGNVQVGNPNTTAGGTVIVDGANSSLTSENQLNLGTSYGAARLLVKNGGSVESQNGEVRSSTDLGSSKAFIDGAGSSWTLGNNMKVYNGGKLSVSDGAQLISSNALRVYNGGTLSISNSAQASQNYIDISSGGVVTVGVNSSLELDPDRTTNFYNSGTFRLVAGAGADSGTYTPANHKGSDGVIQALGGIRDAGTQEITVSDAVTAQGEGSATAVLDLMTNQRAVVTDTETGMSVGAAFLGSDEPKEISFTAEAVGGTDLDSLEGLLLEADKTLLSAWSISMDGYEIDADSPVYLSLFADTDADLLDLAIWCLLGDEWGVYDAADLAFDSAYASFTVYEEGKYAAAASSSFPVSSSFSESSPVPVPGAAWLLGTGLLGLIGIRRKKR